MTEREIVNGLREQYFRHLPAIWRVVWQLETEIRYRTLPVLRNLKSYEQLAIRSRVKDCESAIRSLLRRQEGNVFDLNRAEEYSILDLKDLAGVRVLAFPRERLLEADRILHECSALANWVSDPVKDEAGAELASKRYGLCPDVSDEVYGEYQVVPMLIGLFWEVEHAAMYKPAGSAKGVERDNDMMKLRAAVGSSLADFENGFESFLKRNA
ncbi:MAG: hypothetical protein ACRD27_10375 [Terracidiphilus sp.]